MKELPLAAAQRRLGKPGRRRLTPAGQAGVDANGANPSDTSQTAVPGLCPRLLTFEQAAAYLNLSIWTFEVLDVNGLVPRVRVPLPNAGEVRKRLYDRVDLDRLIEAWKERP